MAMTKHVSSLDAVPPAKTVAPFFDSIKSRARFFIAWLDCPRLVDLGRRRPGRMPLEETPALLVGLAPGLGLHLHPARLGSGSRSASRRFETTPSNPIFSATARRSTPSSKPSQRRSLSSPAPMMRTMSNSLRSTSGSLRTSLPSWNSKSKAHTAMSSSPAERMCRAWKSSRPWGSKRSPPRR